MNETRRAYQILLTAATLWCALVVSPCVVRALAPGAAFPDIVYAFFSRICHQWDSHSLHLFGVKFAVCERCSAIYAGTLAGILLVPVVRASRPMKERWLWLLAVAPMAADVLLNATPWYATSLASRVATGGFFGVVAGLLIAPTFLNACASLLHLHDPLQS